MPTVSNSHRHALILTSRRLSTLTDVKVTLGAAHDPEHPVNQCVTLLQSSCRHESTEEEEGEIEEDANQRGKEKGGEEEEEEEEERKRESREEQMDSAQRRGNGVKLTEQR
ncbi:hypothetical protein GBF38_009743 [Nibea albiflora]|uniref:Uncharacterized protein n=1 Tax=Nibea albiflora TaxID=240163 RepID=A0ACB7F7X5_NIBAL|nr:hypothetical protein GBF38_009743 [Nibea albiflora]